MSKELLIFLLIFIGGFHLPIIAQSFEISPAELVFDAEPGQTQNKTVTITNHASKKSAFNIILGDFVVNKEGKKIDMPPATTEHSLVNWISINPPFLELEPNETKQIIVSMQTPVGDYSTRWANIYVRSTLEQTAFSADKSFRAGLNVLGQIVIRAYQSPKSNSNFKMKISGMSELISNVDSLRKFKATVSNLGEKITYCKVAVMASDLSSAKEIVVQELSFSTLPDSEFEIYFDININNLKSGKYALAAILDYGKQSNLEGTQILIDIE